MVEVYTTNKTDSLLSTIVEIIEKMAHKIMQNNKPWSFQFTAWTSPLHYDIVIQILHTFRFINFLHGTDKED